MDMVRYEKIKDEILDGHEKHISEATINIINGVKELQGSSSLSSPSSSPSQEFSFSIIASSQNSSSLEKKSPVFETEKKEYSSSLEKKSPVFDLSPADEIFFHGHLLPLRLSSHPPLPSPPSSANSLKDYREERKREDKDRVFSKVQNVLSDAVCHQETTAKKSNQKSFSLFGLPTKLRKSQEIQEKLEEQQDDGQREKRKLRFKYFSHFLKRYMKMVKPLLPFRSKGKSMDFHKQSYSFSCDTSFRDGEINGGGKRRRKRRIFQYSAPSSMATSPYNSGPLLSNVTIASSKSDSTMEELQGAIQAAIAHCKNSFAVDEKKQNP